MIRIQKPPEERSCCQKDRGIMSRRLVMPRKPLDIKLTDHPFSRERSPQLLSLPSWRRTGVGRAHKHNKPQQKAGANVSIILGHFQKCLTLQAYVSPKFQKMEEKNACTGVLECRLGSDSQGSSLFNCDLFLDHLA